MMPIGDKIGFSFDNTLRIKQLAETVGIPEIPKGNQFFKYEVGQTVESTGVGPIREGIKIRIVERYMQHGYAYYRGENNQVHRDKDIRPMS
jgi:hypothetical protein